MPHTLPLSCFLSTSTSPPLFLAFSLLKVLPGTQFVLCCYDTKNAYVVLASAYRGRQFNKWPILLLRLISNQHIPRQQTGTQTDRQTYNTYSVNRVKALLLSNSCFESVLKSIVLQFLAYLNVLNIKNTLSKIHWVLWKTYMFVVTPLYLK